MSVYVRTDILWKRRKSRPHSLCDAVEGRDWIRMI